MGGVGWGGMGRLENSDVKLISTLVEVDVGVELGNKAFGQYFLLL